jgi:hypothetical protein
MTKARLALIPVSLLLSSLASAQPPLPPAGIPNIRRGMLGMGVDPLPVPLSVLVELPAIQDELKLSVAQTKRLKGISENLRTGLQVLLNIHRDETGNIRDPASFSADINSARNDAETEKLKVLTDSQRVRLEQVALQAEGPVAFTRPEFLARLGLDRDQSARVATICTERFKDMWAASAVPFNVKPGLTRDRVKSFEESEEFRAAIEKCRAATLRARERTMKEISAVLTEDQRDIYRRWLGDRFDIAKLRAPTNRGSSGSQGAK